MFLRLLSLAVLAGALLAQSPRAFSAEDDKALEAEIRARLAGSVAGKEGFTVHVQGGVAYWDGETAVAQRKGAATRMARSAGAVRVENRIRVTTAGKQKLAEALAGKGGQAASAQPEARSEPPRPRKARVQWRDRTQRR
jgi:hypothetical protein